METRKQELEVLLEFSRAASAAGTAEEVAHAISATLREGFGYDRVTVFLADSENDRRMREVLDAGKSGDEGSTANNSWLLDDHPELLELISSGQEYIYSQHLDQLLQASFASCGAPAHCVSIPLKTPQNILGFIWIDNSASGRPVEEKGARSLLSFARQAAANLQNVRLVEDLRKSEERLRSLVTSLSETLYTVRIGRGSVIPSFYSPQLQSLTGYTPQEAINTPDFWRLLTHPDDRPQLERVKEELLKGRSLAIEYRIQHKNGEIRWVLDTPVPLSSPEEGSVRVNGSILDITDRKLLEDRLRRAQRMETAGTLAAGVAHNFNNYLQIIIFQIGEAQEDLPDAHPAAKRLAEAQDTLNLASALAGQLMVFGRKTEGVRTDISMEHLISQTIPLIKPSLGKAITIDYRPDRDVAMISADTAHIQQAVINLCINARDAMKEGGVLTLRAQNARIEEYDRNRPPHAASGDYVRLQVHDTGVGMDIQTQERVFEPFFTTKPVGQGTGLGLAVTYTIVAEHGGWIEVESKPGKGTLFSIYLPAAHAPVSTPERPPIKSADRIVLVVDADERERERLAGLLETLGLDVLTAEGASDAMAVIWDAGERLHAVICSLALGSVDVAQLSKTMRDEGTSALLILSADKAVPRELERKGRAPDLPLILKPYDVGHLAEVLDIDTRTSISTDRMAESVPSS